MGAYQTIVKVQEMRKRWEDSDFLNAQKILDSIDTSKVKNLSDLNLFIEVYTENERYEDAMRLLQQSYKKTKSKRMLHQMVWLSIKQNSLEQAQGYLKEYQEVAPNDYYNYIFLYQIEKLKGEPYENLIRSLKTLKSIEYLEPWAYELAKLYYKANMVKECIDECSDIILWFGEGTYVEKAKVLRSYFSGEVNKEELLEKLKKNTMKKEVPLTTLHEINDEVITVPESIE